MAIKEQNIERQEGPFLTNSGEFRYKQDDASVRRDQEYFIYYLKSKGVKYELTSTKDEIVRDLEVMQETYKRIHTRAIRDRYPRRVYPTKKKLPFGYSREHSIHLVKLFLIELFSLIKWTRDLPLYFYKRIAVSFSCSTNFYYLCT